MGSDHTVGMREDAENSQVRVDDAWDDADGLQVSAGDARENAASSQAGADDASQDLDLRHDAESDLRAFQDQLWAVMAKQVTLYTMGESTSLPEYDAYRLLMSTCFTLGVDFDAPDAGRVRALLDEGVEAAHVRCTHELEAEAKRSEELWKQVCLSTPLLESTALKDTLESLRGFGGRYDARFFTREIPASIDYPLSRPVDESEEGVRFVCAYLEQLLVENRFLQKFDLERSKRVLCAVHPQYGELIVNLFEPVAANAVGCALAGCDVSGLLVDAAGYARIADTFRAAPPAQWTRLLEAAANRACDAVGLNTPEDDDVRACVRTLAGGLVSRVRVALRHGTLEGVFVAG